MRDDPNGHRGAAPPVAPIGVGALYRSYCRTALVWWDTVVTGAGSTGTYLD